MLYLVLGIFCSAAISVIMRFSERHINGKISMLAVNYFTCMTIAYISSGQAEFIPAAEGIKPALFMGVINGLFYVSELTMNQYNIKLHGVVLPSVFSRIGGLLLPLVVSVSIFGEHIRLTQIAGAVIAVAAIIVINYEKNTEKNSNPKITLMLVFIAEGLACVMSKVFEEKGNPLLSDNFLLYTFSTAFVFCVIIVLMRREKLGRYEIMFGVMIGAVNFGGSRFLLMALETVDAVIAYPLRSVAIIMVIALSGVCIFHEKLEKHKWMAIGAVLVSIVLLNI